MNRTPSAPRSPNPTQQQLGESTKSAEEYEAQQNAKRVKEHLLDEDVNKLESPDVKKVADYVSIDEEEEEETAKVALI
ncbi:hypothetical protein Tco_1189085 [Tanacetum coccineum]